MTAHDVIILASAGAGLFIYALLGCSGDAEATFREKMWGEGGDAGHPW